MDSWVALPFMAGTTQTTVVGCGCQLSLGLANRAIGNGRGGNAISEKNLPNAVKNAAAIHAHNQILTPRGDVNCV